MFITCLCVCLGVTERGKTSLCRTSNSTLLSFCLNSLRQSQRGCWLWFLGLVLMDFCQAAITLNHPYYISAYSHWKEFLHIRRSSPWWFLNPLFLLLALGGKQWNIDKDRMERLWAFPTLFLWTISLCGYQIRFAFNAVFITLISIYTWSSWLIFFSLVMCLSDQMERTFSFIYSLSFLSPCLMSSVLLANVFSFTWKS